MHGIEHRDGGLLRFLEDATTDTTTTVHGEGVGARAHDEARK